MKLQRVSALLAITCLGCTGNIRGMSDVPGGGPPSSVGPGGSGPTGGTGPTTVPPSQVMVGQCSAATLAKPRVWRLTYSQMKNALQDSVGFTPPSIDTFPPESRLDGFANQAGKLTIAPLLADYFLKAADELATNVMGRPSEFLKCPMANLGTGTCLTDFVKLFAGKLWRRPVTDAEAATFTGLYNTTATMGGGPAAAFKNVISAIFMSPNFLYRTEIGASQQAGAVTPLTDYELASALSFMLWDTSPDQTLLDLAAQGKLHDPAALSAQAMRLLASPKAPAAMHNFLKQWLQIEQLLQDTKDPMLFSTYNAQIAADLMEENRLMMNSVMFDQGGDRSFRTLFTAQYGFVNARTAPLYGLPNVAGTTLTKTNLNPAQRRGLLTLGSFLAAHSDPDATALVSRGRYVREEILCDHVPPPDPKNAMFDDTKVTPDMTGREKFNVHTTNPACGVCHQLFDDIGFAMEQYDPIGRYVTMDKGKVIDPSGMIPLRSGGVVQFANFLEFIDKLAKTTDLYSCFSSQYLGFTTGRGPDEMVDCEKQLVADQFAKSGYRMDALIAAVVSTPSFLARKN